MAAAPTFGSVEFATAALLLFRIGGMVLIAPVFSAKTIPMPVRTGISLVLVAVLLPVALPGAGAPPPVVPATIVAELLVGLTIGLGAALLVAAAELAGDAIATLTGLSGASTMDPMNQASIPALGTFLHLVTLTLLLSTDGHLLMLDALVASFEYAAIGAPVAAEGALQLVRDAASLFALGVRFAAPAIAAAMVGNTALGILARAVPQLNLLMLAFPVQISIGLAVIAATLPTIVLAVQGWPDGYDAFLTRALDAFTGRSG